MLGEVKRQFDEQSSAPARRLKALGVEAITVHPAASRGPFDPNACTHNCGHEAECDAGCVFHPEHVAVDPAKAAKGGARKSRASEGSR